MSTDNDNGITVEVSGEENSGKTIVCSIIANALTKSGFTEVTLINQQGEQTEPLDGRTILDVARASYPDLFATPIGIVEVTDNFNTDIDTAVVELSDVTLRVGDPLEDEDLLAAEVDQRLPEPEDETVYDPD